MNTKGLMATQDCTVMRPPFLTLPGLVLFYHRMSSKTDGLVDIPSHKNSLEFNFIVKGTTSILVENREVFLSGGDVLVTFSEQTHKNSGDFQPVHETYCFQLDISNKEGFLGLSQEKSAIVLEKLRAIKMRNFKADNELLGLLKKSYQSFLKQKDEIFSASLFLYMISKLLSEPNNRCKNDEKFKNLLFYIDKHLEGEIYLDELCKVSGFSMSTITHKFRDYTGQTPCDYINCKKIMKATELLGKGLSITETAIRLGFNTSNYFSSVFRRYLAVSPTEYKNRIQ